MALYVNGTNIPQTAGQIKVGGVSITKVIVDGTTVWQVGGGGNTSGWVTVWTGNCELCDFNDFTQGIRYISVPFSWSAQSTTPTNIRLTGDFYSTFSATYLGEFSSATLPIQYTDDLSYQDCTLSYTNLSSSGVILNADSVYYDVWGGVGVYYTITKIEVYLP